MHAPAVRSFLRLRIARCALALVAMGGCDGMEGPPVDAGAPRDAATRDAAGRDGGEVDDAGGLDGGASMDGGSAGADGGPPGTDCAAMACYYVREGASGDGSSWASAFPALPPTLVRGATYFVAAGTYPAYTFDDALDGTRRITIKRALEGDHGTAEGWDSTYGMGQATFDSTLVFESGHYVLDGQVRDEADWFDGTAYGFRVAHAGRDQNIVIARYGISIDDVSIRYVFVDAIVGDLPATTIRRYAIDTDGFDGGSTATGLVFHRMFVRGSNNVWFLRTTDGAVVEYSASDGAQSNDANHGEIVNLYYSGENAVIRYNQFRNAFITGGGGTALVAITQADGLRFYGNVSYDFRVGDGAVGFDGYSSSHNRIHHNTFVHNRGYNAGFVFGSGTDNLAYNNLWVDGGWCASRARTTTTRSATETREARATHRPA
ncbi:MAG: hypothetical protein AB7S26_13240 [Sandaracinaceae bacterium]